jgi:hypothetical protein
MSQWWFSMREMPLYLISTIENGLCSSLNVVFVEIKILKVVERP